MFVTDLRAYSIKTAAELMGCYEPGLYKLVREGHVSHFKIGLTGRRGIRIRHVELDGKRDLIAAIPPKRVRAPKPPRPLLVSPLAEAMAQAAEQNKAPGYEVYFVRCGNFVKVGHSGSARGRIYALSSMTPYPLQVLKVISGGLSAERAIHVILRAYHHRFEWFRLEPELAAAISELPKRGRNP